MHAKVTLLLKKRHGECITALTLGAMRDGEGEGGWEGERFESKN